MATETIVLPGGENGPDPAKLGVYWTQTIRLIARLWEITFEEAGEMVCAAYPARYHAMIRESAKALEKQKG